MCQPRYNSEGGMLMNLIKTKSKLIIFTFGIIVALSLILTIAFMTQYSNLHVMYEINGETGEVEILAESEQKVGTYVLTNRYLYNYLRSSIKMPGPLDGVEFEDAAQTIYAFQTSMNGFNNFILACLVVGLLMFAALLIFANNSRNVYYKSNLIVGIAAPAVVCVMSLVAVIWDIILMANFNSNIDLYKVTTIMENFDIAAIEKTNMRTQMEYQEMIDTYASGINSLTFVLTMIYFIVVIAASGVVVAHTLLKYNGTAARREEIIKRAMVTE